MGRHGFFRVPPIDEDRRKVDRATVRRVIGTFRPYKGKVGLVGLMIGTGLQSVFIAFAAMAAIAAVVTFLFAVETKGRVLEEVSP